LRLLPRFTPALVALAAFVLAPTAASAQVPADLPPGLGIRQLDVETSHHEVGRATRSVTDHVEPGTVVERRIELSNGGDAPRTVRLYVADAAIDEGWQVASGPGTSEPASWFTLDPPTVTIGPAAHATASFRIEVPAGVTSGERYAAIVAEVLPGSEETDDVTRVELRVYLSVGGPEEPPTDFLIDELTPGRDETGAPIVLVGVDNTGGRAVDLAGDLVLVDGPGGLVAGPFPVPGGTTLAPEQHATVEVALDVTLPDGPWRAVTTFVSGGEEREAEAVVAFPRAGMGETVTADALQDRGVLFPVAFGLLLLALVVVLAAGRQRRDRSGRGGEGVASSEVARREPAGMA
jgi:hypothetical protein